MQTQDGRQGGLTSISKIVDCRQRIHLILLDGRRRIRLTDMERNQPLAPRIVGIIREFDPSRNLYEGSGRSLGRVHPRESTCKVNGRLQIVGPFQSKENSVVHLR